MSNIKFATILDVMITALLYMLYTEGIHLCSLNGLSFSTELFHLYPVKDKAGHKTDYVSVIGYLPPPIKRDGEVTEVWWHLTVDEGEDGSVGTPKFQPKGTVSNCMHLFNMMSVLICSSQKRNTIHNSSWRQRILVVSTLV